jgi:2-hydroxymuconate-semialdehyde hydrolase
MQAPLAPLPLTERRLELAGTTTAVREGGDGPPLVLLHGGIECGGMYWAPVVEALAERRRLVIPDVPGLGASEPMERLDAAAFADWFAALLDATDAASPELVAHSLLGSLAARLAAARPGLLGRVVIYGTPAIGRYRMPLGLRAVAIRFGLRPTERNAERFDSWAFFDLERTRRQDPAFFAAFRAYSLERARVAHVKRTMRQLIGSCTKQIPAADLRRIEVPVALVWGSHDRFVPLSLAETAAARFGWPLHAIGEAGHVPHIERPAAFVRALESAGERRTP